MLDSSISAKLDEAFEFARDTTQHGGLVVVLYGWLVYEKYFGLADRTANPDMASCGKAFTSVAMGIALKEPAFRAFSKWYRRPSPVPGGDSLTPDVPLSETGA